MVVLAFFNSTVYINGIKGSIPMGYWVVPSRPESITQKQLSGSKFPAFFSAVAFSAKLFLCFRHHRVSTLVLFLTAGNQSVGKLHQFMMVAHYIMKTEVNNCND